MMVHEIDPLEDARWRDLLDWHPAASVFHTSGWLEALSKTYGYRPLAFTTEAPGERLRKGLVVCSVRSWLTGCRTVSLPFSDHCEPLAQTSAERAELISAVARYLHATGSKYFELRPLTAPADDPSNAESASHFCLHELNLRPGQEELFSGLHRDCIQRKVRRAEREGLRYESGNSESLLRRFYGLMVGTRRRQGWPPQPLAWFRNLAASMGEALTIRLVSKDERPVASILTLQFKRTLVYKYGCSDERWHSLGGMPFLFWQAIREAKQQGLKQLDLGRSEWDNQGLIQFKDRLGAARRELTYWRYPAGGTARAADHRALGLARSVLPHLPRTCLVAMGKLLYRHMG